MNSAAQWLGKVLANAPVALGLTMEAVDVGLDAGLDEGLRFEAAAFGLLRRPKIVAKERARFWKSGRAAFAGK